MRIEAKHTGDFLRKIAFNALPFSYFRYVYFEVPERKDPTKVDQKIIEKYGVTSCRMRRARARQRGQASFQYIRLGHSCILLATDGAHPDFDNEQPYDFRDGPLRFSGYTVGLRNGEVSVEVETLVWRRTEKLFKRIALHKHEQLQARIAALPFYRFMGVEKQKSRLIKSLNQRRRKARLPLLTLPPLPDRHWWEKGATGYCHERKTASEEEILAQVAG